MINRDEKKEESRKIKTKKKPRNGNGVRTRDLEDNCLTRCHCAMPVCVLAAYAQRGTTASAHGVTECV
jgi:hypothetical protein